jgi:hypothetical protein
VQEEVLRVAFNEANENEGEALLQTVCGARLKSVDFVLDYLILGFDERGALTTLVWPEIHDGDALLRFGTSGYRDRLCELIERVVRTVKISEDETICITFENDNRLRIPLRNHKAPGERAIFTAPQNHLAVW